MGSFSAMAETAVSEDSLGETIYIPAYSHIFTQPDARQPLASTVAIHNVDPTRSITLQSVDYHGQGGVKIKGFLEEPMVLAPYETASFLTSTSTSTSTSISDNEGGIGANYIVVWEAQEPSKSPVSQAVMIGGTGTQGISFVTEGRVIDRTLVPTE
ncbi:DUF3124 domain-containing protein [Pseudophaeobacter sp.]|uniref:DUF3124 domain-containing protein n=1 Tax=Pseudophaeobacter sp. TaxID=1971739 RepID=UPI003299E70B